jgi:hypothetical protein
MPEIWHERSEVYVNGEYWIFEYDCYLYEGYKVVTLRNKWRR